MKVFSTSMRNNIYYLDQDLKTSYIHNTVFLLLNIQLLAMKPF